MEHRSVPPDYPSLFWRIRRRLAGAALLGVAVLAGCAAPAPQAINDPYEEANRRNHAFNRGLDRALVRPAASSYVAILPPPVMQGVSNVADNLGLPQAVGNKLLQARFADAAHNTARFLVNSTIGVAGLFDPAGVIGLTERKTDFGETLHTWGMGEGAYLELPFRGPSTERDALGLVVDTLLDPMDALLPSPERHYAKAFRIGSKLGDRGRFADTIDSILYESADSYAQARLLYLQNRRFELGQETGDDTFEDPYADPYGD